MLSIDHFLQLATKCVRHWRWYRITNLPMLVLDGSPENVLIQETLHKNNQEAWKPEIPPCRFKQLCSQVTNIYLVSSLSPKVYYKYTYVYIYTSDRYFNPLKRASIKYTHFFLYYFNFLNYNLAFYFLQLNLHHAVLLKSVAHAFPVKSWYEAPIHHTENRECSSYQTFIYQACWLDGRN